MTTTDHAALIAAAEARAAAAHAEVADLREKLATEQAASRVVINNETFEEREMVGKPAQATVEDALAFIRRRHGRTRSEQLAELGQNVDQTQRRRRAS